MKNNLRKAISVILVISFILLGVFPALADNKEDTSIGMRMKPLIDKYNSLTQASLDTELAKYSDIKNHWGRNFISKISALEIISGFPDGSFRPDDKLLGGQYILMLMRAIGYRAELPQGLAYYIPFVDIALKEGILLKDEISDFTKPITRELAASLARRTLGKYETVPKDYFVKGSDPYPSKGDKGFFDNVYAGYQKLKMTDYPSITSKYLQDVIDCYRVGLLTGSNNKFNPKGTLTRAEALVIIIKLLDKKERVESVPSSSESFKWTNSNANNGAYDNESAGFYENKEYTLYKGLFPMMEIWETAQTMYNNRNLITGGKIDFTFSEKYKSFAVNYFNGEDHFKKYMNYNNGTILPLNGMGIATQRSQIQKGQKESLYDNCDGWLYEISSYEVDKYNKDLKNYVYELLKLWFGKDYEQAKKIHDQYLNIAVKGADWKEGVYFLNNRQIYVGGGNGTTGINGDAFKFQVWAKDFITKDTMLKLN